MIIIKAVNNQDLYMMMTNTATYSNLNGLKFSIGLISLKFARRPKLYSANVKILSEKKKTKERGKNLIF